MTDFSQRSAIIVNALIRCWRSDRAAHPIFELVRDDLDLWVLELDYHLSDLGEFQIELIYEHLERHRALLATLKNGSSDYTLHISAETDETLPLRIPVKLSCLASECGFEIEIYAEPRQA